MWGTSEFILRTLTMPSNRRSLRNHGRSSLLKYYTCCAGKWLPTFRKSVMLDTKDAGAKLPRNVRDYFSVDIACGIADFICFAQHKVQWRAPLRIVMNEFSDFI